MKEQKSLVPKYKNIKVEDGFSEIITYISEDGLIRSKNKSDILSYEAKKLFDQIENKISASNFLEYEKWYKLKNEEERVLFMKYYRLNGDNKYIEKLFFNYDSVEYWELQLPINEWFTMHYSDGGDYRSSYYFFTLKEIKEDLERYFGAFK